MKKFKKKNLNKKKILIVFTNFYSFIKMYKYYIQNYRSLTANVNILVESENKYASNVKQKLLKKFKIFWKIKNVNHIKINYLPKIYIKNFLFFLKNISLYKKNHIKNKKKVKKYFAYNTYDEIWLSNSILSDYINLKYYKNIKLFSHSFTDENIMKQKFVTSAHLGLIKFIIFLFTGVKINYLFYATQVFDNFSKKENINFIISLIKNKLSCAVPYLKNKPIFLIHYQFGFIKNYKLIKRINLQFAKYINEFIISNKIQNIQFVLKAKRGNDQKFTENLRNILKEKYNKDFTIFHKLENYPLNSELYFRHLNIRYLLSVKSHLKMLFDKMYKKKSYWIDYTNVFLKILNCFYDEMDSDEKFIVDISNKTLRH